MMQKQTGSMAVIGTREEVAPFAALGAEVCITDNFDRALEALKDFADAGHPIILISDDLLSEMGDRADKIARASGVAITALPGKEGVSSFSSSRIQQQIRKAIGINIEEPGTEQ